jgi:hypothetical protein
MIPLHYETSFAFFHLQKSLQPADIYPFIGKIRDIFAVLKGAGGGGGMPGLLQRRRAALGSYTCTIINTLANYAKLKEGGAA